MSLSQDTQNLHSGLQSSTPPPADLQGQPADASSTEPKATARQHGSAKSQQRSWADDKSATQQTPVSPGDSDDAKAVDSTPDVVSNCFEVFTSFDDMELKETLLRGVYSMGFENPSIIQQRGIVPLASGRDVIAQSQSGTGKTGTFCIGMLQGIDESKVVPQGLVLAPTRELAKQISNVVKNLAAYTDIKSHVCIGRTSIREDIRILHAGVHVVAGTPGRVKAMIESGHLDTRSIRVFILDEADEMLSRGFRDQIYDVFQMMPQNVQVGLFSATLPDETLEITKRFMRDPVRILVKKEHVTLDGIKQFYVALEDNKFKVDTLLDLYSQISVAQTIIFVNTRRSVDILHDILQQNDFTVSCIHGEMEQSDRDLTMKEFRSGSSRVLLSTDLLGRGIDVRGVELVVNFDLPGDRENYIHRIGRSGRFGRKGVAINFVTPRDTQALRELEAFYNTEVKELPMDLSKLLDD